MADGSIRINTKIDKSGAEKGIEELKKSVDLKVKQLEKGVASAGNEVNKLNEKFNQTTQELANVEMQMDAVGDRVFETYKDFARLMPEARFDEFINGQIQADAEYQKLLSKQEQLKFKVDEYKNKLGEAKGKHSQINSSLLQAQKEQAQVNTKLEESKKKAAEYAEKMKEAAKNSKKTSVENLGIAKNLGGALRKLTKFGVALLGFRGIYSLLKSSMNEWLNGSSQQAKQLQADITNLKANIGAALAPAIQSVLQIFYKILAVVGAIVKAFANINIFAKNTAKSTASTASSAKKASNSMASWDEKTTLQDNSSSGGGAGGGGVSPTDLSSLMKQYEELAEKIKRIFEFIFDPFKKAWETTGQTVINSMLHAFEGVKNLCIAIGSSFAKIWTNGTVQTTGELILSILANILNAIGNIAQAFTDAWVEAGKGDSIIQTIANAINDILKIIKSVTGAFADWWKTDSAQKFSNAVISIIQTISGWIKNLTSNLKKIWDEGGQHAFTSLLDAVSKITQIFDVALKAIDPFIQSVQNLVGDAFAGLLDAIGWVIDKFNEFADWILGNSETCDTFAVVIGSIATAILLVVTAITAWNVVAAIASGVTTALGVAINILTSPITLVIAAVAALIAIFVLLYKNWDSISEALVNAWEWIKEKATEIFTAIGNFLSSLWEVIKSVVVNIWTAIKDFFTNILNGIKNFFVTIWNAIKTTVTNAINAVKTTISNVFNSIKTTISNIWNGIVTTISNVWNSIVSKVKEGVSAAWNAITSVFGGIANWFKNIFTQAWTAVKNVFSTGGKIFDGIKEGIINGFKAVVNAIITGINKVVAIPFNAINGVLRKIHDINILGVTPFTWVHEFSVPQIPLLARGGIVNQPTQAIIGEAGKEAVLPLDRNTEWMDTLAQKIAEILSGDGGTGNDDDININVILDGELIERKRQQRKHRLELATNGRYR